MKASARTERIFSHAATLQQSGRLRNTIHCIKNRIYILNQDFTILIKFQLRSEEAPFTSPISIRANDYDSNVFEMKGNKICFTQQIGDYIREKSCSPPKLSPIKVAKLFKKRVSECDMQNKNKVVLDNSFLRCLQEDLSHIEFSTNKKGLLVARQRDIYAGTIISITKEKGQKLFKQSKVKKFGVIGIRTNDFLSLFTFAKSVTFYFSNKSIIYFESTDSRMKFSGVLSRCKYDEMGRE